MVGRAILGAFLGLVLFVVVWVSSLDTFLDELGKQEAASLVRRIVGDEVVEWSNKKATAAAVVRVLLDASWAIAMALWAGFGAMVGALSGLAHEIIEARPHRADSGSDAVEQIAKEVARLGDAVRKLAPEQKPFVPHPTPPLAAAVVAQHRPGMPAAGDDSPPGSV